MIFGELVGLRGYYESVRIMKEMSGESMVVVIRKEGHQRVLPALQSVSSPALP